MGAFGYHHRIAWTITFVVTILHMAIATPAAAKSPAANPRAADSVFTGHLRASTFFGGSGIDGHYEVPMVVDDSGHVFVASRTSSPNLPVTPGAYDDSLNGTYDVVIAKFSADLDSLLACTYLGGIGDEGEWPGVDLTLDWAGNVVVVLSTASGNYPTTAGAYSAMPFGSWDVAISRLTSDLSTLVASTYLGGTMDEKYLKVRTTSDGRIVVTGGTASINFPTTPGVLGPTYTPGGGLGMDVFVSVLDSSLSTLLASTFIGHNADDIPEGLVISASGGFVIGGWTSSQSYPTTPGALSPSFRGGSYDGFVSWVREDLTGMEASTFLGGTAWDFVYDIEQDANGNILATGHTASRNFPRNALAYDTSYSSPHGEGVGDDAFITRLSADLSAYLTSSYLGGAGWENGVSIMVDAGGRVFVSGTTSSTDFPYTPGTFDSRVIPSSVHTAEIFVCGFDSAVSSLLFGTIIGGSQNDNIGSVAHDGAGNLLVAGATQSLDYPTTPDAYDTTHNGGAFEWGGDLVVSAFDDTCWADTDGDYASDLFDNCLPVPNAGQEDSDGDGVGDSCDCNSIMVRMTGDVDTTGTLTASDIIGLVNFVFKGGATPRPCEAAGDVNCSMSVTASDIIALVGHVFKGGPPPCDVCDLIDAALWTCP